jgi:hypothetical protein
LEPGLVATTAVTATQAQAAAEAEQPQTVLTVQARPEATAERATTDRLSLAAHQARSQVAEAEADHPQVELAQAAVETVQELQTRQQEPQTRAVAVAAVEEP